MLNPYEQYLRQSVTTMTPAETIIALYDKSEKEITKAIYYIENKDIEKASKSIIKVQDIINALNGALRTKNEIAEQLGTLYDFIAGELIKANVSKDIEVLKSIIPFFTELKDAFEQISRKGQYVK